MVRNLRGIRKPNRPKHRARTRVYLALARFEANYLAAELDGERVLLRARHDGIANPSCLQ